MTTLMPLIREFVQEVMYLDPEERSRRIGRVVDSLCIERR
jgi:hypothetical protein